MDWINYFSLATGTVGAILGVRSELWRRREFSIKQEDRVNAELEKNREAVIAARNILAAARAIPIKNSSDLIRIDFQKIESAVAKFLKLLESDSHKIAKSSPHLLRSLYELPNQCNQIIEIPSSGYSSPDEIPSDVVFNLYQFWQNVWEISMLPVASGAKGAYDGLIVTMGKYPEISDLSARMEHFSTLRINQTFRPKIPNET